MTTTTVADWQQRARRLAAELVEAGKLSSPEWRAAVEQVPRHEFVPTFYVQGGERAEWATVSQAAAPQEWLDQVYSNQSLVTQVGDVRIGRDVIGATSSSSAPGLMTRMLEMLDVRPGQRVLEIGTGTGYNAALLCHRLGSERVFSVDVDAGLVQDARVRLRRMGYTPTLAAIDGADGLPEHGPFDRIVATCAVSWVPWAWAEQVAPGGFVLVDVKVEAVAGNLVLLHRYEDRLAGRFDTGSATFMHMRTTAFALDMTVVADRDRGTARCWVSDCAPLRMPWDEPTLWFLIHLELRERVAFGYTLDENTGQPGNVFFSLNDGSWCEAGPVVDGERDVWEGGPRDLWQTMSAVIGEWESADRPGWERFGLTVTPGVQTVWLDDPGNPVGTL